jgi:hypothetical protein
MIGSRQLNGLANVITLLLAIALMVELRPILTPTALTEAAGNTFWDSPRLISTTAENGAFIPVLKADNNGRLMIVYNQMTAQGVENPYYRDSLDGGKNWREPAAIHRSDSALLQTTFSFDSDGNAHAVWRTRTGVWHSREDQWPNVATPITSTLQLVFSPDITAAPNGTVHVVWAQQDYRIYHASSDDGGNTWSTSHALTDGVSMSAEPAIAADLSGNLNVVWEERIWDVDIGEFRSEIRHLLGTSNDNGVSWADSPTILSAGVAKAHRPAILTQPGEIHVAFAHRVSGDLQYAYYVRYDSGVGWSAPVDITHDNPVAVNANIPFMLVPALALCNGTPYVYFHGSLVADSKEVILGVNRSDEWAVRDYANVGSARAVHPSVACTEGKIHTVYEVIVQPKIDHQVYYTYSYRHSVYLPVTVGF